MNEFTIDRRSLFKGAGALVISIGIPCDFAEAEIGSASKPPLSPDRLDSWLAVKSDGDVVAYFGKMDMGQGVDVAIAQMLPRSSTCRSRGSVSSWATPPGP